MENEDSNLYVKWFRHSSPYINAYREKIFVIMLPGEALAHENFVNIAYDITLLNSLGVKLVLVHGARPQIETALSNAGVETDLHGECQSEMHNQLRVTDNIALELIKQVVGKLRIDIEAIFSTGLINSPMHGADISISSGNFITARPYGIHNGIDYAHTGEVRKVNKQAIQTQLNNGNIVLISTLGYSPTGEVFNLTVEEVASATAIALAADKLLIFGKEPGILNKDGEAISKLSADEARKLIADKTHSEGIDEQLKNLELSVKVCGATVKRSQVISYQDDGALLTELFTRDGSGTLITQESYQQIRGATIDDVGGILELIQPLENDGTLVHRSRELLETEINQFTVIARDGTILACCALYPLSDSAAELACISTHPDYRNNNLGQLLLENIENHARTSGISSLFVLTTKTPHWFQERGFSQTEVDSLPEPKKQLYNYQRNSKVFIKSL